MATPYLSIRVSTLRGDSPINFDVYVKLGDRHVLYCRKGDSFAGDRLARLKRKKLKQLFILHEHENNYRSYLSANIEMAYTGSLNKPLDIRAEIIQGAQQAAAEDLMETPSSKDIYDITAQGASRYVEFLLKEDQALKSILNVKNTDGSLSHHCVAVSTVAIGLSEQLGFLDKGAKALENLAVGCLVHDIGHFYSGLDVARPIKSLSKDEYAVYRKHPQVGADLVKSFNHYNRMVIQIILQHEEYMDGSGFPQGLRERELDPLVLVASLANSFDRLVSFELLPHKDALKRILISAMGLYPLEYLKALQSVLKDKKIIF